MFSAQTYRQVKGLFGKKEAAASELIASMAADGKPTRRQLTMLDMGCGDGRFSSTLAARIAHRGRRGYSVIVSQVDPWVAPAWSALRRRACAALGVRTMDPVAHHAQSFQTSLRYDVVLLHHVLYHIPEAAWGWVLRKYMKRTAENGILVVVLASKTSSVYHLCQAFDKLASRAETNRAFGDFVFAEDFEEAATRHGLQFERFVVSSEMDIETKGIIHCGSGDQVSINRGHALVGLLAFLYRVSPDLVAEKLASEFFSLSRRSNGSVTAETRDVVFVWRRKYAN